MDLSSLVEMSRRYGADEGFVLAGGGNASYKENGALYVKCSGTQLSDISPDQFVAMDLRMLLGVLEQPLHDGMRDDEREEKALSAMMAARLPGEESKRPSVESILHALFPYKFVLHLHPALLNGLTCAADGEASCRRLFGDRAVWIGLTKPGLVLAQAGKKAFEEHRAKTGAYPQIVIIKNHGVFAAADSTGEIDAIIEYAMGEIKGCITEEPDFGGVQFDKKLACSLAPALRMLYSDDGVANAVFCVNKQVLEFVSSAEAFEPLRRPFTPDHIVYCKAEPLFIDQDADIAAEFRAFAAGKGYKPRIVAVRGAGFFALGKSRGEAGRARSLFLDAVRIAVYARAFGGADPLTDELSEFILNWEAEQYRSRAPQAGATAGRLEGRIAIVTGGAQGFGKGIAEALAAGGAYVAVADLNPAGAEACASQINAKHGRHRAMAVSADVSDEGSAERMVQETVLEYGGLDVLVSNAGVLVAGRLEDMTKANFDFVTGINYTGYFLCVKFAAEPMKIQNRYAPDHLTDVIEINSKSGLEGSSRNSAYSGSKFGGIGLTQSFALELVGYGIKVNAICPGNLFDGPLWSDPAKGLFKQYLDSGKVAGAKTIGDVRKFYESKVPLKRGCTTTDVARAVLYLIEQKYETGQALPVTGGQIMLH